MLAWLDQNWFSLVQSIGIIGSILLATRSMRRERRARRIGDYLALAQQHRDLWGDLHRRPELARVTAEQVDLLARPIVPAEEEFLILVIAHFQTGWLLAREDSLLSLSVLARDARAFFQLPLPFDVWDRTKAPRDPAFVQFVEDACARPTKQRTCFEHFLKKCRCLRRRLGRTRIRFSFGFDWKCLVPVWRRLGCRFVPRCVGHLRRRLQKSTTRCSRRFQSTSTGGTSRHRRTITK